MDEKRLLRLLQEYPENRARLGQVFGSFAIRRQVRVFFQKVGLWLTLATAVTLLFLLLERTPMQSELGRFLCSLFWYAATLTTLGLAIKALVQPPRSSFMAREIEEEMPQFRSALVSAAEFAERSETLPGTSPALTKLTISQAAEDLQKTDLYPVLHRYSPRPVFAAFLVLALIIGSWTWLSPSEVKRGFSRLINPFASLPSFSPLHLKIEPGNAIVAKGESLQISAIPNQDLYQDPVLTLFKAGSKDGTPTEMYPDETASRAKFVFTLTGLQESTDYQVGCEKFLSERFSVSVLPRPDIRGLELTIVHPDYLGVPSQRLPDNVGECSILKGSRLQLSVKSTQKLASASLVFDPPASFSKTLRGDLFQSEFSVATTTRYSVSLTNEFGLTNENPVKYQISIVEDQPPTVEILKPGMDLPFPKTKRLDVKIAAKDDIGVVAVLLNYSVGNRQHWIPQNMKADFSPKKEFDVEYPWLLDTLAIEPGTEVSYYVKAEDGFKPEPHIATSPIFKLAMPSMYDVYKGSDEAQQDVGKQLKDYVENQKLRRDALSKAYEEMKHEGKLDFEAEKQLEKAIKEGQESEKKAQEILENFQNTLEKVENNPFSSPESLQKMQKVQELLNQVLDDDAKKLMKQLQESLKDMKLDPKDLEKYEQAFKMDEYMKNLDRTIELLEQTRKDLKMNALGEALEDLRRRQERLASETAALEKKAQENGGKLDKEDEAKLADQRKQQEKIGQEMEDLKKQTKEMADEKPKDGQDEHPAMQDVKNLQDRFKQEDFQKELQKVDQSLQNKDLQGAREGQQKLLKFLESLAKDGKKICQTCQGGGQTPQLDLSRFIRKALSVSHDQETILRRLDNLPDQFMRGQLPAIEGRIDECSVLQLLVKRQAQDLENALETFVRSSFSVNPDILTPLLGVQDILGGIVKDLEDRAIAKSTSAQREVIRRFNLLAIALMQAQDQQQSSSSQPMNAMQQFKQLTQRQLSLYQQMQKQQMSPADQQMMEQLKRMAMEQRKVREALEQLMREGKNQKQMLGRMDDVLKDMQDLETKILDPKLRKDVAEKQKSLYERMLKAQKSIRNRDEEKEERKAEKAREVEQLKGDKPLPKLGTDTRDLSKDYLTDLKEDFPRAYETEINDYYKSLNLYGNNDEETH